MSDGEFAHNPPSTYDRSCDCGVTGSKYVGAAELANATSTAVNWLSPSSFVGKDEKTR